MSVRWHAYGQLLRAPNLVTAGADSLAGFLFVGGAVTDWRTFAWLAATSVSLYAGGVALNDVCDAARDAASRPDRPIPAGIIPRRRAALVACTLLAVGCGCATMVSIETLLIACALTTSIVLYDAVLKRTPLAPITMGLCRALNFTLGLSVAADGVTPAYLLAAAAMGLYVTAITFFARNEAGRSDSTRLRIGALGVTAATLALGGLGGLVTMADHTYYVPVAFLALFVAHSGHHAARENTPASVQNAVRTFVLAIVLFDACIVWSTRGVVPAGLIATLLIPAALLSRAFHVT